MPILNTPEGPVHYERYGKGRPVILLHGWLGSWELWRSTALELGKEFTTYSLDFLGFGELGVQGDDFSVDNYVQIVAQFMDRMGIVKAPLVGHSMGGTVSLMTALRYPEKVVKVVVIGSPVQGTSLNPLLKLAGFRGWMGLAETAPYLFNFFMGTLRTSLRAASYALAKDGRSLGNMFAKDLSKLTVGPFFESIRTLRDTDLRARVGELRMPIMGIYGRRDRIVSPQQAQVLKAHAPGSRIAWFTDSGHFPMLDEFEHFHQTVRDFLNNG